MATTPFDVLSERVHEIDKKFGTHEAVCAQRYLNIETSLQSVSERVSNTNGIMLTVAGAVVLQLVVILGYLLATYVVTG